MGMLWQYKMVGNMGNQNAGYSMWGFAQNNGKDFFVKQFLSPKYPVNDKESSPERIQKKIDKCNRFIEEKKKIYAVVNASSDGNDVRIQEFFRVGSKFYISMEKINALPWTIEDISKMELPAKRRLCAIIAHSIAALHSGGLIHADIKHENILFTKTPAGTETAKVTDFDSAFLESDPPAPDEEIIGDWLYFSPEVWARMGGEPAALTCKMDVFALGVLFHQYFSGKIPEFDQEKFHTPGQAAKGGGALRLSDELPEDVKTLLAAMLSKEPDERPTSREVFLKLRPEPTPEDLTAKSVPETPAPEPVSVGATGSRRNFCGLCGAKLIPGMPHVCGEYAAPAAPPTPPTPPIPPTDPWFFCPKDL
ncbi:MAG: protein kinase [Clostridia bacterium]|nr:protein kinase [Clostridia bacterium]